MIIDQTGGYGGQFSTVLAPGHIAAYIVSSQPQAWPGSLDVSRVGPGSVGVARAGPGGVDVSRVGPGDTTWTKKE